MSTRLPLPPFTHETAVLKVRLAEDGGTLVILRK
jgi:nuclear transport factor 2 (NTF2) superfamily protein